MEPTLFDAIVERDEAMGRVERNTDTDWAQAAENTIRWLARSRPLFTTDDVWFDLASRTNLEAHDNRAIGPVMKRMQAQGVIQPTDVFRPSTRRHAAPIRCWKATS